ncbi:class I SAM-dependent methyltransferase [Streptomyces poriticola]|uniref:class I SAM-dependent methyltransferase n=1 Tax=Streptomyces poriticola TaxID=3120506 RepID=UPI002FCE4962
MGTAQGTGTAEPAESRPGELKDVPGWFWPLDQVLFTWFLQRQTDLGTQGDLLELGAYLGKSAILLGHHLQAGETFTVCDLFGSDAPDQANRAESAGSYATLTRQAFERNYLAFHDTLPTVVQAPTSVITDEVAPGSCRFVHVDASHLYEHVRDDIEAARELLLPEGIVVLDDYRSEHTPGVAVAAWEAVLNGGLRPVCLSTQKLYATWADPEPVQEELLALLEARSDVSVSVQEAAGHRLVRARGRSMQPPPFPHSRHYTPPAPAAAVRSAAVRPAATARVRRLAVDLLPPVITRAVRRYRTGRTRTASRASTPR